MVAVMTLFMCLIAAFKAPAQTGAAAALPESVDGVVIGDSLPDWFWGVELQVVNHPDGRETISIGDYKDKLLVLDFWATYCKPCVESMDKWDELQKQFANEVKVFGIHLFDYDYKAEPFSRKKEWELPVSVGNKADTLLNNLFYAHTRFGQVWVKDGKLFAIPKNSEVKAELVANVIANRDVDIEMDDYLTYFDKRNLREEEEPDSDESH